MSMTYPVSDRPGYLGDPGEFDGYTERVFDNLWPLDRTTIARNERQLAITFHHIDAEPQALVD